MSKGVADEYSSSLAELKENSKPRINMLTMLAEDYIEHSPTIVRTVEAYLQKVPVDIKLPVLYLIDSIVKNVGKQYVGLFTQNIVSTFCSVFEQVDEKIRSQMFKLRQTWNEVFPPKKLYALDARVNSIDPAWPITAPPPHGRIHINPKFLNPVPNKPTTLNQPTLESISGSLATITDGAMREELIKKQKELVELQKQKVELEILQTKAILEEQQKKLDIQTANFKGESTIPTTNTKPKVPRDIPESLPNKAVNETKPDKSKFEGAKRRDPRLHSRKVNDPRLSSKKENQQKLNTQPQQDTSIKPPQSISDVQEDKQKTHKIIPKEEVKSAISDVNKKSSENTSNTSRHQRKRSDRNDRYKKHKGHKPRMKVLFGDSPDTKESDSRKNDNSISKQIDKSTKISESGIRNAKDEMNSRFTGSVTYKRPTPDPPSTDIKDNPKKRKEAIMDKIEDINETVVSSFQNNENITPSITDVSPPLTKRACTNVDVNSESEVLPMEIDEKGKDSNEQEAQVTESRPIQFKIDETPIYVAATENDSSVFVTDNHSTDLPLTGCGDIDLRLLPTSKSELEPSAEKKPKADLNKLFGEEDVDLRKSLVPPPPPPPIISKSDLELSEGWANIKRSNPDKNAGKLLKKRTSLGSSPKTSIFRQSEIEEMTVQDTLEADTEDRSQSLFIIMKEAEEQLKNETITYTQYNQMLKGVMSMNEESKLQEALRKDEMDRAESPESGSNSSVDTQHHFEKDIPSPSESSDSYRSHSTNCDGKSGVDDNLSEQPKTSNDNTDGSTTEQARDLRRRTRFKSHEPYHRPKRSGNVRFYQNEAPFFSESNNGKLWQVRHQPPSFTQRPRKDGGFRWSFQPPNNRQKSSEYTIMPAARIRGPRHHGEVPSSLPPADPAVLDLINSDPMTYVTVGNSRKEVRFYGENAIVMLDWDDPRDLMFQPGSRRVIIDQTDSFNLLFNSTYREVTLNYGLRIRIRLGAPTRELFIDGRFYDIKFGGPPVEINIAGRTHVIQLEGPPPFLQIGQTRRTDLVAGKVNLIIDGNIDNIFHIYLDAKPQKFEINGVPFIIRFVEALQTVVINGQPLKMQFAGIPVPIFFHNERHFLRLTQLPQGIVPGFVKILNMEGGRLPTPPPRIPPPPPIISDTIPPLAPPAFMNQPKSYDFQASNQVPFTSTNEFPQYSVPPTTDKPIDALPSALPPPMPRFPIQNYVVEPYQEAATPTTSTASTSNVNPAISNTATPNIDVVELYQKLVAMGVVAPKNQKEELDDKVAIKVVDLDKPETLKQKQPGLINRLYSGIQCSSCGVRFPPEQTVKYSQHLDWHFRQNRREKNSSRIAQSRKYNYDLSDWVQFQEIEDDEDRAQSWFEIQDKRTGGEEEEETADPTVPAKGFGENPCCVVCRDKFDQFFNEDKEEWQLKRAVCAEDKLYHPLCLKDEQESSGRNVGPVVMTIAEDDPIETIDLDAVGENGEDDKSANIEAIVIESSKSPDDDKKSEIIEQEKAKEESNEISENPPEEPNEEKPMEIEDLAISEEKAYDSDDDILAIEDIKPHIDTYDILDDDEEIGTENVEEQTNTDLNNSNNDNLDDNQEEDNEIKTDIVIKKEPLDIVIPSTNTSHINETIYLDGNSEFSAPKILLPKKIKINISSVLSKNNSDDSNAVVTDGATDGSIPFDYAEPLPPGEEVFSGHLKPRLIGNRLVELPPVNKGKEMSGLCSIM